MASVDKIVAKMKRQPNGIRFDEGAKVLHYYGYRHLRTKGSHYQYVNDAGNLITVKYSTPNIKKSYVVDILERIGE